MYSRLVTVHDVVVTPGEGAALAGTDEHVGRIDEAELRSTVGTSVELRKDGLAPRKLAVIEVKTTTAMSGAKNIFVLVGDDTVSRDWIGGEVWSSG